MTMELTKGVYLHVYSTEKFKTIRIKIKFVAPLTYETLTKRVMLGNMLETNSKKYPTQTILGKQLSDLYGAQFGLTSERRGKAHIITVEMSLVNEKFLASNEGVFQKAISFMNEIIFRPNIEDNHFHQTTFQREKENVQDTYDSYFDDKQLYAGLKLQELYFQEKTQQIPGTGEKMALDEITSEELYTEYLKMLHEDTVDIYVLGDVSEEKVKETIGIFEFTPRPIKTIDTFYRQKKEEEIILLKETQTVMQSQLTLAYHTDVYYDDKDFYAGIVLNGLFGGFSHSKLFLQVREKEGLAYEVSSSLDAFRGMMVVHAGIEASQAPLVRKIISDQLEALKTGEITEGELEQTKKMLINQLYQTEDQPGGLIEKDYTLRLIDRHHPSLMMDVKEWVEKINAVNIEEVKEVASRIHLQADYLLEGE